MSSGKNIISPNEFFIAMAMLAEQAVYPDGSSDWDFIDTIDGHKTADEYMLSLLESLGYSAGCAIFRSADKWYA